MDKLTLLDQVALQCLNNILRTNNFWEIKKEYPLSGISAIVQDCYNLASEFIAEKKRRDHATK